MYHFKPYFLIILTSCLVACGGSDNNEIVSSSLSLQNIAGVWKHGHDGDSYTIFDNSGLQSVSKSTPTGFSSINTTNTNCYEFEQKIKLNQVADGEFKPKDKTILGTKVLKSVSIIRNAETLNMTINTQQASPDDINKNANYKYIIALYPTNLKISDMKPVCTN